MRSLVRPFVAYLFVTTAFAGLPDGAQVVQGNAQLNYTAGGLVIQQNTQGVAITWNSFIVPADKYVQFNQPGSSAVALNMVLGNLATKIDGRMAANGNVILINPNGIMVGPQGRVETGGSFIASTKELKDYVSFLNNLTSKLTFEGPSKATIVNFGKIQGRHVFLVAQGIQNHGLIKALNGTVGLAAGTKVEIQEVMTESGGTPTRVIHNLGNASIVNKGVIEASLIKLIAGGPQMSTVGAADPKGWDFLTGNAPSKIENQGTATAVATNADGGKIEIGASHFAQSKNAKMTAASKEGRSAIDVQVANGASISGALSADDITVVRKSSPTSIFDSASSPRSSGTITNAKFDGKEIAVQGLDDLRVEDSIFSASRVAFDYASAAFVRNTVIEAEEEVSFNSIKGSLNADNIDITAPSAMLSIKVGGDIKFKDSRLQVLSAEIVGSDLLLEFSDVDVASQLVVNAIDNVKLLSTQIFAESFAVSAENLLLARPPPETHTIKSGRNTSIETFETGRTSILAASGVGVVDVLDTIAVNGSILYAGTSLLLKANYINNIVNLLLKEDWKRKKKNWFRDETVLLGRYFHESPSSVGTAGDLVIKAGKLVNTGALYGLNVTAVINGALTNGFTDKKITTPLPTLGGSEIDLSQIDFLAAMNRLYGSKKSQAALGDANLVGSLSDVLGTEFLDGKQIAAGDVNLTSLIQSAVPQATGKQYLDNAWTTPEKQLQGLIENTSKFLAENPKIKAGKILSSAEKELIKDPMIWLEQVGKDRLVPKLYLPIGSNTYTTGGYLEAAKLSINAELVHNTGVMVLGDATLTVTKLINERRVAVETALAKMKSITGSKYKLVTYDDLQAPAIIDIKNNLALSGSYEGVGGIVTAGGNITAVGETFVDRPAIDIDILSTNASLLDQLAGARSYEELKSASPGVIHADGTISIQMGTIEIRATQLHAAGDVTMIAQGDFAIDPLVIENDSSIRTVSLGGISETKVHTEQLIGTQIGSAGGSVLLSALSGSLRLSAANIVAADTIRAEASMDIQLDAERTTNWSSDRRSTISLTGIGQSYNKQRVEQVYSTSLIANNVYIKAGQDISAASSVLYANASLTVGAGGDFTARGESELFAQTFGGWSYGSSVKMNGVDVMSFLQRPIPTLVESLGFTSGTKANYGIVDKVTRSIVQAIDAFDTMVSVAGGVSKIADGQKPKLNFYVGIQFGTYKGSMNAANVKAASIGSGKDVVFDVGGDLLFGDGTRVQSEKITAKAGGNMILTSANNSLASKSKSSGVSIGLNFGDSGIGVNFGGSQSRSSSSSASHVSALIQAVDLDISVGKDLEMLGSQLKATGIQATVGGDLRMRSQLGQSTTSSKGYSGSVTIGTASAGSFDYQRSQSRSALVDAWAEIMADEELDLRIGGRANLGSATIISLNDALRLEAQGLELNDLTESSKLRATQFGASGGISDMSSARGHFGYASNDFEARANTIIGNSGSGISGDLLPNGVQRNLANRRIVTLDKEKSFGVHASGGLVRMSEERFEQGIGQIAKAFNDIPKAVGQVAKQIQDAIVTKATSEPAQAPQVPTLTLLQLEAQPALKDAQADSATSHLEGEEERSFVSSDEIQSDKPASGNAKRGSRSTVRVVSTGRKNQNVGSYSIFEPTVEDVFYSSLGEQAGSRESLGVYTGQLLDVAADQKANGNWFQRNVGVGLLYGAAAVAEGWNDTIGSQEDIQHRILNGNETYETLRGAGNNKAISLYASVVGAGLGYKTMQAYNDPEADSWDVVLAFGEDLGTTLGVYQGISKAPGKAIELGEGIINIGKRAKTGLSSIFRKSETLYEVPDFIPPLSKAEQLKLNVQSGLDGEFFSGIVPGSKMRIGSATGTAAYRVPDDLSYEFQYLKEVKNVKELRWTSQLTDFGEHAKEFDLKFIINVPENVIIKGSALKQVDVYNVELNRILPPKK